MPSCTIRVREKDVAGIEEALCHAVLCHLLRCAELTS